jgi:hypothetical protein
MALPQLTVGRFQPTAAAAKPSVSWAGGYQPNQKITPGQPGSQYGGQYMYPGGGAQGGGAPAPSAPIVHPTIQLPQGTPGQAAYTPDYSSMIGGSWEVGAAESAMASQMAAARAQFQAALRQQFIDLGYSGDTKDLGDMSKYIDKTTLQKAIDNKYSAYAQIKKQQTAATDVNAALALSQGLAGSGSATAEAESLQSQVEQARYSSLRDFLSGGQQGLSNLTNMKNQLAAGVAQARFAAAQRLAQMYPPTPAIPATQPNYDDFWGSYQGGIWQMPGQGQGWIVPGGNATPTTPSAPWWVGPGSGVPGDLSWLHPH